MSPSQRLFLLVMIAALLPLAGCGQNPDSLAQQQIAEMNELADALEAGAEKAELEKIRDRMQQTKADLENLELSDDEKKELANKYGEELKQAALRLVQASAKQMDGMMRGMTNGAPPQAPGLPAGFPAPSN